LPDVAFFCTFGGAGSASAFTQMQGIAGKTPRALCAITAGEVSSGSYRECVSEFAKALEPSPSATNISSDHDRRRRAAG
jgi:hypothetical protein